MEEFDYEEIRRATDDFSTSRVIGRGSHGCVYKGELKDGRMVAVKGWSSGLQYTRDNSKLENEVAILSSLPITTTNTTTTTTSNNNIMSLLGVSRDPVPDNKLVMVMEFMPNGSLHDMLHHVNHNNDNYINHGAAMSVPLIVTWPRRVEIATQIARALRFLHSIRPAAIVHRDVKSANVLFDPEWNARLADFGLALRSVQHGDLGCNDDRSDGQVIKQYSLSDHQPAGTIGYLDPCYTEPCKLSTKNDVFSFGVLVLEILSSRKAIDVSNSPPSVVDWALPMVKHDSTGRWLEKICDKTVTVPPYI